jgi:hypothetical protein
MPTDHLTAIKATIPAGDPSSNERMGWCKAAAIAIADVCLEHSQNQTRGSHLTLADNVFDAQLGLHMAMGHAGNHLARKGKS